MQVIVFNLELEKKRGVSPNIPVEHQTNKKLRPCKETVQSGDTYDTVDESVIGRTDETGCQKGKSCPWYIIFR